MDIRPVTLTGHTIRLEPLSLKHVPGLAGVGLDPLLWRWVPVPVSTQEQMYSYVQTALEDQQRGMALPFAIVQPDVGVIGSTRFANIVREHRRLEIGWTWVARSHQRTAVNTEAKLLLLKHAFETLGAYRVELKTDALNEQSRKAIRRLGAVEEGIFRRHVITASGRVRDTVYYSILDSEWPKVRADLEAFLVRHRKT
jgi:N-acetyltransferase